MSASPIAVPSRGRRLSSAALSCARSVVGETSVTGLGGERDDPDADLGGQLVDERLGGGARRVQPGGVDIGRLHRAGDVHGQDHGGVLAGTAKTIVGRARPMSSAAIAAR